MHFDFLYDPSRLTKVDDNMQYYPPMLYLDDPWADFLLGLGTEILWEYRVQPQFHP